MRFFDSLEQLQPSSPCPLIRCVVYSKLLPMSAPVLTSLLKAVLLVPLPPGLCPISHHFRVILSPYAGQNPCPLHSASRASLLYPAPLSSLIIQPAVLAYVGTGELLPPPPTHPWASFWWLGDQLPQPAGYPAEHPAQHPSQRVAPEWPSPYPDCPWQARIPN